MVPSFGLAGLNRNMTPGLFPSLRVKLGTGINSPSSFSFESAEVVEKNNKTNKLQN